MDKDTEVTHLIEKYKAQVYRTCFYYTGDQEEAKDLLQEISIIIWKKLQTFRNQSSIGTWIYRISVNACLMHRRKSRQFTKVPIETAIELATEMDDESRKLEEHRLGRLIEHIKVLPEMDKLICILHLEGNTYEQISEIVGLTSGNVGARLSRIRAKIKVNLNEDINIY